MRRPRFCQHAGCRVNISHKHGNAHFCDQHSTWLERPSQQGKRRQRDPREPDEYVEALLARVEAQRKHRRLTLAVEDIWASTGRGSIYAMGEAL